MDMVKPSPMSKRSHPGLLSSLWSPLRKTARIDPQIRLMALNINGHTMKEEPKNYGTPPNCLKMHPNVKRISNLLRDEDNWERHEDDEKFSEDCMPKICVDHTGSEDSLDSSVKEESSEPDDALCCDQGYNDIYSIIRTPQSFARRFGSHSEPPPKKNVMPKLNPFTPKADALRRPRLSFNSSGYDSALDTKSTDDTNNVSAFLNGHSGKLSKPKDTDNSRYHKEFVEIGLIGKGEFGSVFKCINILDGCVYAIKKSLKKPLAGVQNEKTARNEVYAFAALGNHPNIVRYHSAWAEDHHIFIQNEFCNGGSLADVIAQNSKDNKVFTRQQLRHLLSDTTEGLKHIHSLNLVHLDIKPGNILISCKNPNSSVLNNSFDDGFQDCDENTDEKEMLYKIGDLGHVTTVESPNVEEGDCRYLSREILLEDYCNLPKADIFALALTVYEAGGGGPLEKNGPEWHSIRDGNLKNLGQCSKEFNALLKSMINPVPEERPSACDILKNPVMLSPTSGKTRDQLLKELQSLDKMKKEIEGLLHQEQ